MDRRVPVALALGASLLASTARADLTVFFATDGPSAPLLASASSGTREEPAPERPAPREVQLLRVGDGSGDEARLRLLRDDGTPDPHALDALSILARPRGVPVPDARSTEGDFVAPDLRRLHVGLLERLARLLARVLQRLQLANKIIKLRARVGRQTDAHHS